MAREKKKNALGRGLSALLEDSDRGGRQNLTNNDSLASSNVNDIPFSKIQVNPFQPRADFDKESLEELAQSIKIQGIIQPITVRKLDEDNYQLISGERRFHASKLAGMEAIPAYIRTANDQQMLEMALIENIQRQDLNSIEVALSYQRLITDCQLKHEELGDRVGKKRTTVNNYLRLLKLPPDIQDALRNQVISMGHARAVVNVDSIELQLEIFKKTVKEGLSVRKVEDLVRNITLASETPKLPKSTNIQDLTPELKQVQAKLSSQFGTRVQIKLSEKKKGEIRIPYISTEDLNRILELLEN